jgi:ABC-type uncharacterized transport system involved in gliding motility auxiliary subunit
MHKDREKLRLISSSHLTAAILLVLVLMVIITLLSKRHYVMWDLTSTGEHTLSPKTIQLLKNVKEPVTIKAFVRVGFKEAEDAKKLLSSYSYQAPYITYGLIDPERNPAVARRYNVKNINTFILEGYERSQTIRIADEETITNALLRLMKGERQRVYWVSGHGERAFKGSEPETLSRLQEDFSSEDFEFSEVHLMREDIPKDASLVVVAAPDKRLLPEEVASLRRYLLQGGRIIIFLEPFKNGGLENFIKSYGIRITDDIVVDKMSRVMGGDYLLPMVANYGTHEITKDFRLTSLFFTARTVEPGDEQRGGLTLTALAYTSPDSWSETDRQSLDEGTVPDDKGDKRGPLSLATIVELEPPMRKVDREKREQGSQENRITGKGRLAVFGDVDFASNRFFDIAGNGDFVRNTINYLVGRGELITIKKRHRPIEPLMLTQTQGRVVFWLPVVVMPLIVLILGIVVWRQRRSR